PAGVVAVLEKAHRGADVGLPPGDREVAVGGTGATTVERERVPAALAGDALGQLGIGAGRCRGPTRAGGEAVTDHDAGRGRARTRVRAECEVTSQLDAVGQDRLFQAAS